MSDDAVSEYLQSAGDGVLTLHADDPRSIPVSFGYDDETDRCVFQLLSAADGADTHPREETPATLVAYDVDSPDDWASVVVDGVLARIPEPGPDEQRTYAEQATSVGMSVFDADPAVLDATWYELRPTDATGRQSP
ncbi:MULTISPECIES: pyridoxamine 5'-phosphate oxidase family protein [Halobacterium]|uniref:pyridoxamine 5'-phosphate oxidase family protein n=1 Tax=Halobacterium TaxID=2239 RepID=UPI00073F8B28|nr:MULTISPECIES: pyridoxamine 5'-phosphate oxidase family protein [Halobacterium]MCG1003509.1 pyridoxamine 5'-phosphate oxidase family protein [Halobacterium noricense]